MSEDHIKTVVIDPPLEYRADEQSREESINERTEPTVESDNSQSPPLRSWLS